MSQAGGPNSAGSVNIDFTGNVAPLEQAAKKAEVAVQQSAEKMKAATVEAAQAATAAAGSAGGVGPSSGFGVFGGSSFGGASGAASSGGRFSGLINGAKSAMVPLNGLFAILGRVNAVIALVSAGGYGLYRAFTASARAAAESKKELEGLSKSLDGLYSQFKVNLDKSPAQIEAESLVEIEAARTKADSEAFARYKDGILKAKDLAKFREQNDAAAERSISNVRKNFDLARNKEATDSQIAYDKKRQKNAYDLAKIMAENETGALGATLEAVAEEQNARATLQDEELANRLLAIDLALQRRLTAIRAEEDEQAKAIEDRVKKEQEAAQRVRDIWTGVWRDIAQEQVGAFGIGGMALDPRVGDALELRARQNYTPPRVIGGI